MLHNTVMLLITAWLYCRFQNRCTADPQASN